MTFRQDRLVVAPVPLRRCNEADAAVAMPVVVPRDEVVHPGPGRRQTGKALFRPLRAVLQRPEQGFRIRVVVAHPGSSA